MFAARVWDRSEIDRAGGSGSGSDEMECGVVWWVEVET